MIVEAIVVWQQSLLHHPTVSEHGLPVLHSSDHAPHAHHNLARLSPFVFALCGVTQPMPTVAVSTILHHLHSPIQLT